MALVLLKLVAVDTGLAGGQGQRHQQGGRRSSGEGVDGIGIGLGVELVEAIGRTQKDAVTAQQDNHIRYN